tara:strand:+ start:1117 stop:1332 length:216 start_codon:yes stop_codon:yes gene_type:complete
LEFDDKITPKKDIKNTIIKEYSVENLKEMLKNNIKIGIVINEPPAPNKPNKRPDKKNNIYPIKLSIILKHL